MQQVSLVHCLHDSEDKTIREAVGRAIELLEDRRDFFSRKNKILIKANIVPYNPVEYRGRLICLTDPTVLEAVIIWLREINPTAEIILADDFSNWFNMEGVLRRYGYWDRLKDHDVIMADHPPSAIFEAHKGGLMFKKYWLPRILQEAEAVVSVAHMKAHVATGFSLSIKNLFGWPPVDKYAHPRRYLHSQIRLPYVLADIGLVASPDLCVVDGLIALNGDEWVGDPLCMNLILAGSNAAAVDSVGARLMGFDSEIDYPQFPYMFDRNHLLIASKAGLGPVAREEIHITGESIEPFAKRFHVDRKRPAGIVDRLRRNIAEQALFFREERSRFLDDYLGWFIGLMKGEILFAVNDVAEIPARSTLSPHSSENAIFFKRVVEAEDDWENYEIYEDVLNGTE